MDIRKLASELVVDEVVPGERLRQELLKRYELYSGRFQSRETKKHGVHPV